METIHQKINAYNIHTSPLPVHRASSSPDSFPLVTSDVIALIKLLKPNSCLIDPLPVCIFKEYNQQLVLTVRNIVNNSLSNVSVPKELMKLAEHLRPYLENNKINNVFQSAYRPYHSTETAVIKIFSDICIPSYFSDCTILVLKLVCYSGSVLI